MVNRGAVPVGDDDRSPSRSAAVSGTDPTEAIRAPAAGPVRPAHRGAGWVEHSMHADGLPYGPRQPVNAGFGTTPFARLARTHFASVAGDAVFVIGMASSVFFSVDFNESRWKVAQFLLLTLIPFTVVGPVLGPAIDRAKSGRRLMILGSCVGRALLSFLIVRDLNDVWFYLEAFGMLVLGKTYHVAKSAMVPTTVRTDDELVEANSKLALSSGIAGATAAAPAGLLMLAGTEWVIGFAGVVFLVAAGLSLRINKALIAELPADELERAEVRGVGIRRAAEAMGFLRATVGFLAFLLAFQFKDNGIALGMALAGAQGGVLLGAFLAPRLRESMTEERIITLALGVISATAFICAFGFSNPVGAAVMSLCVGCWASAAKQSFDAIVQRDAPDANFGRQFARFESRFQLFWCGGAMIPVIVNPGLQLGFLLVFLACATAGALYATGARRAQGDHERMLQARAAEGGGASESAPVRPTGFERVRSLGRRRRPAVEPEPPGFGPPALTHPHVDLTKVESDPSLNEATEDLLARLEFRPVMPPPEPDPADDDLTSYPTDISFLAGAATVDLPVSSQAPASSRADVGTDPTERLPTPTRLPGFDDDPTLRDASSG